MTDILIDIEHSIPQQEFFKFEKLAKLMGKTLQEVVETCMYERRDELIDMLENNVPKKDEDRSDDNTSTINTTQGATEGTKE